MGGQRKSKINLGNRPIYLQISEKNFIFYVILGKLKPTGYYKSTFCYPEIHFPMLKCSAHPFCFIQVFVPSLQCCPTK